MTHHYRKLPQMLLAHFVVMFIVMYAMVYTYADVYFSLNKLYMTVMMVAPMGSLMVLMMPSMFPQKKLNLLIHGASAGALVLFFYFMRAQTLMTDAPFLKSMIPHHSGAILMCERAPIQDPELKLLCETIKAGQQKEIDQMNRILTRLPGP